MMKLYSILFWSLISLSAYAQCGREFPSGFYHFSEFVTNLGDTVNRVDSEGYDEGLHYYLYSPEKIISDSSTYIAGIYGRGVPTGDWIAHCKDGSYAIGSFNTAIFRDRQGRADLKNHGIYAKIGIWRCFDKDSNLVETLRYDRGRHTDKTYKLVSNNTFVCIKSRFNNRGNLHLPWVRDITKEYATDGKLMELDEDSFWRTRCISRSEEGVLTKFTCRKLLGIPINRSVTKRFSPEGKRIEKYRDRCWTKLINAAW